MRFPYYLAIAALLLSGAGCSGLGDTGSSEVGSPSAAASATLIDLRGQRLEKLPASVLEATALTVLNISGNRLTGALPSEIGKLKKLRILRAKGNLMTGVPAEIGQLTELRELDLSNNKLTGLPLELGNLKNLRRLDLRGNEVSLQDLEAIRAALGSDTTILTSAQPAVDRSNWEFGKPVDLKIGTTVVFVDGLQVKLMSVTDSRCPKDVQCIWQGELTATFQVDGGGDGAPQPLVLGTVREPKKSLAGYSFELTGATAASANLTAWKDR